MVNNQLEIISQLNVNFKLLHFYLVEICFHPELRMKPSPSLAIKFASQNNWKCQQAKRWVVRGK